MAKKPAAQDAPPPPRKKNTAVIAGTIASLAVVAAVVWVAVSNSPGPSGAAAIEDPFADSPFNEDQFNEGGTDMLIELSDPDDPERLTGEIRAASFEPIDPVNRRVVEPEAWIFLDDGRIAHIEADRGRLAIPQGQTQPRSGTLAGNVVIRLFDGSAGRPDPETDPPLLRATSDQPVSFDLDLARLSTDGRVVVRTNELEFIGTGLWAVLNERERRLEQLEIAQGEKLTYFPPAESAVTRTQAAHTTARVAQPGLPTDFTNTIDGSLTKDESYIPPPDPFQLDHYLAIFEDSVVADQDGRRVLADRLDVWVRLIDNKLPSFGGGDDAEITAAPSPITLAAISSAALLQPTARITPPRSTTAEPPVTLTWTGPLRVVRLDREPEQLDLDDVALKFTAQDTGIVRFEDPGASTRGQANEIEYAAQRERIVLSGQSYTVRLEGDDAGRLANTNRIEVGLADGSVRVIGPGGIYDKNDIPGDPQARRYVEWQDQADFRFRTDDGRITEIVETASFFGGVAGKSGEGSLDGNSLDVWFDDGPDGAKQRRLARLESTQTRAGDGEGAELTSASLTIDFNTRARRSDPEPTRLAASGDVRATQADGSYIHADRLTSGLGRTDNGSITPTRAIATGNVRFADSSGTTGAADRLEADVPASNAVLYGTPDQPAEATRAGATIRAGRLLADGERGALDVLGPGVFLADLAPTEDAPAGVVHAAWSTAMSYREATGNLVCFGDVEAVSQRDGFERDTLVASQLFARFESTGETEDDSPAGNLVDARLLGAPGQRATSEIRRFKTGPDGRPTLAELFYLESPRIDFDRAGDRLYTPRDGRLLLVDRRAVEGSSPGSGPGTTAFEWAGSMTLDRAAETATFIDDVLVEHLDMRTDEITVAEADRLEATFDLDDDPDGSAESPGAAPPTGALRALHAQGRVLLTQPERELLADDVRFDADSGVATATSAEGSYLIFYSGLDGQTYRAQSLRWNTVTDRVDILRPAPASAAPPQRR
ncbi:MAG: hypothetical protein AAFR38_03280 [Planctomycetota bacterium]